MRSPHCDITHCTQADSLVRLLTRSPARHSPPARCCCCCCSSCRLARRAPRVNARQLRETGDHPDRQCLKQVIIRPLVVSGLSQLVRIMRLISSLRPARAMACRTRSGLDKPIKQTLKGLTRSQTLTCLVQVTGCRGPKLPQFVAHLAAQGSEPSLRPMPCPMHASHQPITINISASCRDLGVIWQIGCSLAPAPRF